MTAYVMDFIITSMHDDPTTTSDKNFIKFTMLVPTLTKIFIPLTI